MNKDFTVQELTNLIGQNAQTVSALTRAVGDLSHRFLRVEDSVKGVTKDITDIKGDIVDIKANEEITFSQQQAIQTAVHSRVYQLLGVPIKKSDRTVGDAVVVNRYSQLFHSRCYRDVMNKGHTNVGMPILKISDMISFVYVQSLILKWNTLFFP